MVRSFLYPFVFCICFLTLGLQACKSGKKEVAASPKEVPQEYANYKKGLITMRNEDGCPYVLEIEDPDFKDMLDPINLEETYKTNQTKVWVQFVSLRKANRCSLARPIQITAIAIRE